MPDPNATDLQDLVARTSGIRHAGKPRRLVRPMGIAAVVLLIVIGVVVGVALARSDRHTVTSGELTLDQYKISNESYLLALREGTLAVHVVRHTACFSIRGMPIIWPHGLVAYRQRSGLVLIRDGSGKEIARSGEVVDSAAHRSRSDSSTCHRPPALPQRARPPGRGSDRKAPTRSAENP